MWKPVTAEPIVVSKEVQYVKIQAELLSSTLSDITLLYLVTGMFMFVFSVLIGLSLPKMLLGSLSTKRLPKSSSNP